MISAEAHVLTASAQHEGQLYTYDADGQPQIALASRPSGPTLRVYNRSGEAAVTLEPDDAGAGTLGLWAPDGDGRTLSAAPTAP